MSVYRLATEELSRIKVDFPTSKVSGLEVDFSTSNDLFKKNPSVLYPVLGF